MIFVFDTPNKPTHLSIYRNTFSFYSDEDAGLNISRIMLMFDVGDSQDISPNICTGLVCVEGPAVNQSFFFGPDSYNNIGRD